MKVALTLLSVVALAALAAARAPAQLRDTSCGWAIIVAADYEGAKSEPYTLHGPDARQDPKQATLYDCVQRDAIRAYVALTNEWHLAPDHIFLLAEGPLIDRFTAEQALPEPLFPQFGMAGESAAQLHIALSTWRRELELEKRPWVGDRLPVSRGLGPPHTALEEMVHPAPTDHNDGRLPVSGAPTARNFRAARDFIKSLATPNQFVMYVVSAHAGPTSRLVALPPPPGQTLDQSSLAAADFALGNCPAHKRAAFLDCSLTRPDEAFPPARKQAAQENLAALKQALDAPPVAATIMVAGRGDAATQPYGVFNESGFLYAVSGRFLDRKSAGLSEADACGAVRTAWNSQRAVEHDSAAARMALDFGDGPAPINEVYHLALIAPARKPGITAAATTPAGVPDPNALTLRESIMVDGKTPATAVRLGYRLLVKVPGYPNERADKIIRRFGVLLKSGMPLHDYDRITEGVRNNEWTVVAPTHVDREYGVDTDWLVTADSKLAALSGGLSAHNLAIELSALIREGLVGGGAETMGPGDEDGPYLLDAADELLIRVQKASPGSDAFNDDVRLAEEKYLAAIGKDPSLAEAWLHLARLYHVAGDDRLSRETISQLRKAVSGFPPDARHVVDTEIVALTKDLGPEQ
ncbi:MAG TPA: hypothetical protein VKT77_12480 [Chthonomonadaceae bacterium]|nr:hypothetical protein [Chthonomonadaceae bacterium]